MYNSRRQRRTSLGSISSARATSFTDSPASMHDVEATRFNELVEYTPFAVQCRYAPGDLSARPLDRDTAIERR